MKTMTRPIQTAEDTEIRLGGVCLLANQYLPSNAQKAITSKPEDDVGYAYFNGKTLILHDYKYSGGGIFIGENSVGMAVSGITLTIRIEGKNNISVDALTYGIGIDVEANTEVKLQGKGSLSINVQNGEKGNCGIGGDGTFEIKSGTLSIQAGLARYTVENGKKHYNGDSYAVNIHKMVDKGARITGNDKRGAQVNINSSTQVVYDFSRRIHWLILLLGTVSLCAICVTMWALFFRSAVVLTPDYAPVEEEVSAEVIPNEQDTDKLPTPDGGGGAVGVMYSADVIVDLSDKMTTLYFGNPSKSNQDMVLQIVIKDTVIAQSGTLKPGKQLKQLKLLDGAVAQLAAGGYDGLLRALLYNPDTGERTIMTTDIAVKITVQD